MCSGLGQAKVEGVGDRSAGEGCVRLWGVCVLDEIEYNICSGGVRLATVEDVFGGGACCACCWA